MKTIFHFDEFNRTFFLIDDDVFNDRFPPMISHLFDPSSVRACVWCSMAHRSVSKWRVHPARSEMSDPDIQMDEEPKKDFWDSGGLKEKSKIPIATNINQIYLPKWVKRGWIEWTINRVKERAPYTTQESGRLDRKVFQCPFFRPALGWLIDGICFLSYFVRDLYIYIFCRVCLLLFVVGSFFFWNLLFAASMEAFESFCRWKSILTGGWKRKT